MEYIVIEDDDNSSIEDRITELLGQGWRCQGGISVSVVLRTDGGYHYWYAQAMVRSVDGTRSAGAS